MWDGVRWMQRMDECDACYMGYGMRSICPSIYDLPFTIYKKKKSRRSLRFSGPLKSLFET
jgi:hypothetical protein